MIFILGFLTWISFASANPEIDGGKLDAGNHFPAEVRLDLFDPPFDPKSPTGTCTGTLIAPQVVVTAAHCLKGAVNSPKATITVNGPGQPIRQVGRGRVKGYVLSDAKIKQLQALKNLPESSPAQHAIVQPDDLAILILDQPQTLKSYPKLACKPPSSGTPVTFAGFGFGNQVAKDPGHGPEAYQLKPENRIPLPNRYTGSNQTVCHGPYDGKGFVGFETTLKQIASCQAQAMSPGDSGAGLLNASAAVLYGVLSGSPPLVKEKNGTYREQVQTDVFAPVTSPAAKALLENAKKQFPKEMGAVSPCV